MDKVFEKSVVDVVINFFGLMTLLITTYYFYFNDMTMFVFLLVCDSIVVWYLAYQMFFWLWDWYITSDSDKGYIEVNTTKEEVFDNELIIQEETNKKDNYTSNNNESIFDILFDSVFTIIFFPIYIVYSLLAGKVSRDPSFKNYANRNGISDEYNAFGDLFIIDLFGDDF